MLELTLFDGGIVTSSATITLSYPDAELPDAIADEARKRTTKLLSAVQGVPLPDQLPAFDDMEEEESQEGRKSDDR